MNYFNQEAIQQRLTTAFPNRDIKTLSNKDVVLNLEDITKIRDIFFQSENESERFLVDSLDLSIESKKEGNYGVGARGIIKYDDMVIEILHGKNTVEADVKANLVTGNQFGHAEMNLLHNIDVFINKQMVEFLGQDVDKILDLKARINNREALSKLSEEERRLWSKYNEELNKYKVDLSTTLEPCQGCSGFIAKNRYVETVTIGALDEYGGMVIQNALGQTPVVQDLLLKKKIFYPISSLREITPKDEFAEILSGSKLEEVIKPIGIHPVLINALLWSFLRDREIIDDNILTV